MKDTTTFVSSAGLVKIKIRPLNDKLVSMQVTVKGHTYKLELTTLEARLAAKRIVEESVLDLRPDAYKIKGDN